MKHAQAFFHFMNEREHIRQRKAAGEPWPWTQDKILQTYKFTNVKRLHDRTTQWVLLNWYAPRRDNPLNEILFNCALFRYFGTSEFAAAIGWQPIGQWDRGGAERVRKIAKERLARKERVFTGAYVITNQGISDHKENVVIDHFLTPFAVRVSFLANIARTTKRWRRVAEEMRQLKGFGGTGFMTKEVLQDAMLTPVLEDCVDRNSWCPAGPGARRGLNRVHGRLVDQSLNEEKALEEMKELLRVASVHVGSHMPPLELHDIQFQLCEFDKYERVRLGEGRPRSTYQRRDAEQGTR